MIGLITYELVILDAGEGVRRICAVWSGSFWCPFSMIIGRIAYGLWDPRWEKEREREREREREKNIWAEKVPIRTQKQRNIFFLCVCVFFFVVVCVVVVLFLRVTDLAAQLVERPHYDPGNCGFDHRPRDTNDFKSGTSSFFALRSALRK